MTDLGPPTPANWPTSNCSVGAFAPLTGFLGKADAASVTETGTLVDGTPGPSPSRSHCPTSIAVGDKVTLQRSGGAALATLTVTERDGHHAAGPVEALGALVYGPFRGFAVYAEDLKFDGEVLAVTMRGPSRRTGAGRRRGHRRGAGGDDPAMPLASSARPGPRW